jgi:drug/metabolite transporter (DMT)-like permease
MGRLVVGVFAIALAGAAPPPKQVGALPEELRDEAQKKVEGKVVLADVSELKSAVITHTIVLAAILVLACGSILCVILRSGKSWDESPRGGQLFGLVFIVGVAALLLSVGFSGSQLAAVTGILGTALGYLFGRQNSDAPRPNAEPPEARP